MRAEAEPGVEEAAPERLDRAREHLESAQMIWEDEGDSAAPRVEHEAYLADRNARIALSLAVTRRNEQVIENAEVERAELLAEARGIEARRAQQQAQAATALAAAREREADRAQDRAQALADQLQTLQAEQTNRGLVLTLGDVLFDTDEADLKPGAESTIDELARFLRESPDRRILIEGHTDSRGSEQYNQALSERRAQAVRDALMQRGIAAERMSVRGMGEQSPVATNETTAGRQQNRRVEIVVSDEDGNIPSLSASADVE